MNILLMDGRNPARKPVEVGSLSTIIYKVSKTSKRWLLGISEPSTIAISIALDWLLRPCFVWWWMARQVTLLVCTSQSSQFLGGNGMLVIHFRWTFFFSPLLKRVCLEDLLSAAFKTAAFAFFKGTILIWYTIYDSDIMYKYVYIYN